MLKSILSLFLFTFVLTTVFSQKGIVQIECFAPDYIGQTAYINEIEDYLTMKEASIASATVGEDSVFKTTFEISETQKLIIRLGNNWAYMYAQAGGNYAIYFPKMDRYTPYRPAGNLVEATFYGLDSTDINYQILAFNRWFDDYNVYHYSEHKKDPVKYNKAMDRFKEVAQAVYAKDTGTFLYDYIRFTIASNDDIHQVGNRNKYEKHDFYIKNYKLLYKNDAYMNYVKYYYKGLNQSISMELNNRIYLGILKNSPTLIFNAMGKEYTLTNPRIRELVMIQMLAELYFKPDYPQTNIIEVLDSVSTNGLFPQHRIIARNMIERLTEANSGSQAPIFVITTTDGNSRSLADFKGKYLYLHFFDPSSEKSKMELEALKMLQKKYRNEVTFLTISKASQVTDKSRLVLNEIPWEKAIVPDNYDVFWKRYKAVTFPMYILIDPYSYIVQAPALGPMPNNLYETIDKVFFNIQKALSQKENRGR